MGIFGLLHPARIIKRKAIWDGLFGPSKTWKAVAFALLARDIAQRLTKSGAEVIDVAEFGAGRNMEIVTSRPLSRREAKRLRKQGKLIPLSKQRSEATLWAESKRAMLASAGAVATSTARRSAAHGRRRWEGVIRDADSPAPGTKSDKRVRGDKGGEGTRKSSDGTNQTDRPSSRRRRGGHGAGNTEKVRRAKRSSEKPDGQRRRAETGRLRRRRRRSETA